MSILNQFVSKNQLEILNSALDGEEGSYFEELMTNLTKIIETMPKTYDTSEMKAEDITVHLHYFHGNSDWWITERDIEKQQLQAFGLAKMQFSEQGYIPISELIANNVELDMHWQPVKLSTLL